MKNLIIFATLKEAVSSIDKLNAKENANGHFDFDGGRLLITGIGSYAAMAATFKYAQGFDLIINCGIAGSLNASAEIGKLYTISKTGKYVPQVYALDPKSQDVVNEHLPSVALDKGSKSLITSDFPLYHAGTKKELGLNWDLVDMEGYGVAYAAHVLGKKALLLKVVSDFAEDGGRELIKKNLAAAGKLIAESFVMQNS